MGRRKEEESSKGRWNNEGLRLSEAHGSCGTSVPRASRPQLHSAQRVAAESQSPNRSRRAGLGGWPCLASADCFFFFFFFFPLSLRLCAGSHVGELIKPHVPPAGSRAGPRRPAGGATASLMSPPARWGTRPAEDCGVSPCCRFPRGIGTFCRSILSLEHRGSPGSSSLT